MCRKHPPDNWIHLHEQGWAGLTGWTVWRNEEGWLLGADGSPHPAAGLPDAKAAAGCAQSKGEGSIGEDGFDHAEGLGVGGDVVDAVDVGALLAEPGGECDSGPVAVGDIVEAGEA